MLSALEQNDPPSRLVLPTMLDEVTITALVFIIVVVFLDPIVKGGPVVSVMRMASMASMVSAACVACERGESYVRKPTPPCTNSRPGRAHAP